MASTAAVPEIDTKKTEECTFVTTHFGMGIGRMKQVKNLKVETNADPSQLRHQKKLMDVPELEEIRSQDGYMKRHLDSISCRYDEATRFVPNVELAKLYKALVAYQTIRRPKLVENFMKVYRKMEADDFASLRVALGDTFHRGDYPAADEVEKGFTFYFYLRPVGKIDLSGLPDFIVAMELEKEQTKRAAAVEEWTKTMRVALAGVVNQLFNALKRDPVTGARKKLFDSTVEGLTEFCKTFPQRNLGNDDQCMKLRNQILDIMKGVDTEMLRESESLKDAVAAKLETVSTELNSMIVAVGRKFR